MGTGAVRALSAATIVVAVAGYAVIVVAGRAMDTVGYEAFTVFWGLFFALAGLLDGLLQETTRAVAAQRVTATTPPDAAEDRPHRATARPLLVTAGFAAVTAALALGTAPLWADQVIPADSGLRGWGVALLTFGLASYTFQAAVCGLLSATTRWGTYAWLISVDSAVRVVLALVAWALGWHLLAFLVVTVLGAFTWIGTLLLSPATRSLLGELADVPTGEFIRRTIKAMLASGANAVLITGFPVLITVTSGPEVAAGALAAVITAVTLTRAPVLVPLQRFQPALIVHFATRRDRILRACVAPCGLVIGVAAVGGVAAYWLAEPIMLWFFDADLVSSPIVLAALTVASGSTAVLMITGSATHAAERHTLYLAGWAVATVVAVGLLAVDASPETRAVLSLGVAPLVGAAVHLGFLVALPDAPSGNTSGTASVRTRRLPPAGSSARTPRR
ncbi:MAG TPA: hypothetical protein H9870_10555 [Candidatus Corynebacterium avicola]|uniref:Polysaccharide biosynthesis protein n=1 Tax=Candidatus Corynebacterium avicola TaxID=2838527 RepID=A0A9D1RQR9_9CORY|nr:hypothetical protein [Candidatus Corynebacterium avicola]